MICDIEDGKYRVERAYDEDGNPYFVSVKHGSFDDREMAMAGAYMWWCVQSQHPTGHTTLYLDIDEDNYRYHEGHCGELYHVHDSVKEVHFDLDKKTVTLQTYLQL